MKFVAACSGLGRTCDVSGRLCIRRRQPAPPRLGDGSSCWGSQGASPVIPTNWLTLAKKRSKSQSNHSGNQTGLALAKLFPYLSVPDVSRFAGTSQRAVNMHLSVLLD